MKVSINEVFLEYSAFLTLLSKIVIFINMRSKHATPKKPQQILFSKNTYGPKVKVQNWDYQMHVEKKDNNVYRDHLSNHLSTYLRWGDQDQNIGKSETRSMLEEIYQKTDPIYAFKPLVNFTSYPCTE